MSTNKAVLAAALSGLLLTACGSRGAAIEENDAAAVSAGPGNAGAAGLAPGNGSAPVETDPGPPPDAVSHPDGYLPNATDPVPPPGSNEAPPATEDEYLRNGQAGR